MRFLAALILCSASLCAVGAAACRHPSESDAVTVTGLVQSKLNVSDFSADMCQEKNYIVLQWHSGDGYSGGQALTKKNDAGWTIVRMTTGSLKNVALLESLGVPYATAAALANDIVP
jgi:hypothetical protein